MLEKVNKLDKIIGEVDKKVIKTVNIGVNIGLLICILSIIFLYINRQVIGYELYCITLEIFKLGTILSIGIIVIGLGLGIVKIYYEKR